MMNSAKPERKSSNLMKYVITGAMAFIILLASVAYFISTIPSSHEIIEVTIERFETGHVLGYIYFAYHVNANGYLLIHINNRYEEARYFLANSRDSTQLEVPPSANSTRPTTFYSFLFIKEGQIEVYKWVNLTYPEDAMSSGLS
jgi:hypothetical protein